MMMMIMRVTHVHCKTASWMCSASCCGQEFVLIIKGLTKPVDAKKCGIIKNDDSHRTYNGDGAPTPYYHHLHLYFATWREQSRDYFGDDEIPRCDDERDGDDDDGTTTDASDGVLPCPTE
jgi:hypothetical protein